MHKYLATFLSLQIMLSRANICLMTAINHIFEGEASALQHVLNSFVCIPVCNYVPRLCDINDY